MAECRPMTDPESRRPPACALFRRGPLSTLSADLCLHFFGTSGCGVGLPTPHREAKAVRDSDLGEAADLLESRPRGALETATWPGLWYGLRRPEAASSSP
jgi:hypothetical protein